MEWAAVLHDCSRVDHYPHEIITLSLSRGHAHAPSLVFHALASLAELHASGDYEGFRDAMRVLAPWRDEYFTAKRMSPNKFPVFAVELVSIEEAEKAVDFFRVAALHPANTRSIELNLEVRVRQRRESSESLSCLLSCYVAVLEIAVLSTSTFRFVAVDLDFKNCQLKDDDVLTKAHHLCELALNSSLCSNAWFKASLTIPRGDHTNGSVVSWGKLFQAICCVGCDDLKTDESQLSYNILSVNIASGADDRIVAGFFSAAAFSRGFARLILHDRRDFGHEDERAMAVAKYTALALHSTERQWTKLDWSKAELSRAEVDAMEAVFAATSLRKMFGEVLWERGWSPSSNAVELALAEKRIAKQFGYILRDLASNEHLDVFIPGVGQCAVQRGDWEQLHPNCSTEYHPVALKPRTTSIDIDMNFEGEESSRNLGRLIEMIGRPLERVSVCCNKGNISTDLIVQVSESCPALREFYADKIVVPSEPIQVDPARILCTELTKLELHFTRRQDAVSSNLDAFFSALIPLIGSRIEWIELRQDTLEPFERAFVAIMASCPKLTRLHLSRLNIASLDPLIEAYHKNHTRLSSLTLFKCPVSSASLVGIADFLRAPSAQGSSILRDLLIDHAFTSAEERVQLVGLDTRAIGAFAAMLKRNETLAGLQLVVTKTSDQLEQFVHVFDSFNDQDIPVGQGSIGSEPTLALFHALRQRKLPFSADALRLIMAFAADRVRRYVAFSLENSRLHGDAA